MYYSPDATTTTRGPCAYPPYMMTPVTPTGKPLAPAGGYECPSTFVNHNHQAPELVGLGVTMDDELFGLNNNYTTYAEVFDLSVANASMALLLDTILPTAAPREAPMVLAEEVLALDDFDLGLSTSHTYVDAPDLMLDLELSVMEAMLLPIPAPQPEPAMTMSNNHHNHQQNAVLSTPMTNHTMNHSAPQLTQFEFAVPVTAPATHPKKSKRRLCLPPNKVLKKQLRQLEQLIFSVSMQTPRLKKGKLLLFSECLIKFPIFTANTYSFVYENAGEDGGVQLPVEPPHPHFNAKNVGHRSLKLMKAGLIEFQLNV